MIKNVYGTVKVNGYHCPVVNLIDVTGEETDDVALAVTVVVEAPDGRFVVLGDFDAKAMWPLQ